MARTTFTIIDQSDIPSLNTAIVPYKPLYMVAASSDKGPEEYGVYEGQDFVDTFVSNLKTVFDVHGQPLLQAIRVAEAGGKIFFKRVVAPDATLANICVSAQVTMETEDVTDADGNQLYIDPLTNQPTTTPSRVEEDGTTTIFEKLTTDVAKTSFIVSTVEGNVSNNLEDLALKVQEPIIEADGTGIYPLFVIADAGRGVSKKIITLTPDYVTSRSKDYMKYVLAVKESNITLESHAVTMDYGIVENGINMGIEAKVNDNSSQIRIRAFYNNIEALCEGIATATGMSVEEVRGNDFLFGKTRKGLPMNEAVASEDSIGLSTTGCRLMSGDNGSFGTNPMASEDYVTEMVSVFDGSISSDIYDVDNLKLDMICDANYPEQVKRVIEELVEFRGDCFYFRDLGLGLRTLDAIKAADVTSMRSYYMASYHNSYDVYDPYSRKRINVTIMYDLAPMMVNHFVKGENRAVAGILHQFTFDNVIEGSINLNPKITPKVDQKQELDDARINYMAAYDGVHTLDCEWTSQEPYTQLSFINNILLVQKIIKEIRTRCPKIRYSFIDGGDELKKYKEDIEMVLQKHQSKFDKIEMVYFADPLYEANKIFYAGINVKFRNFIQDEKFVITALQS